MIVKLKTIRPSVGEETDPYGTASSPKMAKEIARSIFETLDAGQEHVVLMVVNAKNRVIGFKVVASGGVESSPCDPKILLRSALLMGLGASGIIIAHCHPSGDAEPSEEDNRLTAMIRDGSKLLCLRFLDHIILGGKGRSYSYKENGRIIF